MWNQSKQASSATVALAYITVGALTDVWSVIYYLYLQRHEASDVSFLWVYGFFFSGLVLLIIGFALGRIGRAARQAEIPAVPSTQIVTPGSEAAIAVPAASAQVPVQATTPRPALVSAPAAAPPQR